MAKLTITQLRKLLAKAGRQRGIDTEAARLQAVLRAEYLHHPRLVEDAFGMQALALLRQLNVACANADELAAAAVAHFDTHPDAEIVTSLPGLGSLTGARVLAEIGDDRSRFADARSLKAYAGAAPVTRASGKSLTVTHRRVKNQRLVAGAATPATDTPQPNATCSTACSAACTTASTPTRPTTKTSPSHRLAPRLRNPPFDNLIAWDVFMDDQSDHLVALATPPPAPSPDLPLPPPRASCPITAVAPLSGHPAP